MTARWEYLFVTWISKRETVKLDTYTWTYTFWIKRPGSEEEEERLSWSSETKETTLALNELLNELGGEGWEMVSETVLDSVVFSSKHGVESVGAPLRMRWNFKRPAPD